MEAALAAPDDSSPSVADSTPEPSAPADTTPAPAVDATPQPSDTGVAPIEESRGPIPFDRHQAVLTNERNKFKWLDDHGGVEQARQKLAVTQWLERDPVGFMRTYAASQNLDLSQLLPQQPAPQPKAEEPPQPDILLENGQMTYSNERMQQLLAFQERQLTQRFDKELAPIKEERATRELMQSAGQQASQQIAHARQHWADFKEHEADIKAVIIQAKQQHGYNMTLAEAYAAVVPHKLTEKVKQAETQGYQKALTEFQTKAGAAGQLTPRTSGAVTKAAPASIREALEQALNG